jgi:hypothetical protein
LVIVAHLRGDFSHAHYPSGHRHHSGRGGRDPFFALTGSAARDGCINVPGIPHNSADCSRIPLGDLNSIVNRDTSDLDGRRTGASENAERNRRILEEMRRAGVR